jgi:hypothetical protein
MHLYIGVSSRSLSDSWPACTSGKRCKGARTAAPVAIAKVLPRARKSRRLRGRLDSGLHEVLVHESVEIPIQNPGGISHLIPRPVVLDPCVRVEHV